VALAACAYDATVGIGVLNVSVPPSADPARRNPRTSLARRLRGLGVEGASYRNGAAEAIEAVSALDNVPYPISVLKRCSAKQPSPMY
jgi:hypothetical protein